jgi:hypothetical protein
LGSTLTNWWCLAVDLEVIYQVGYGGSATDLGKDQYTTYQSERFNTWGLEDSRLCAIQIKLKKIGTPTDNVYWELWEGGATPLSGVLLETSESINGADISTDYTDYIWYIDCYTLENGTAYWLTARRSGGNNGSNYYTMLYTNSEYAWDRWWKVQTEQSSSWDLHLILYDDKDILPPFDFAVVSPANESTITDLEDKITFSWEGWDFEDIYEAFVFWFVREQSGLATNLVVYYPTSTEGQISYPFSDFEFEKNGYYFLKARKANGTFGEELIFPNYWILMNIEGWEDYFEMTDWSTWYGENVDKFSTSTAVFSGVAGLLSPIFNKIGEFGESAESFLNTDEAYKTGYDLGIIVPLFTQYIDEIEVFFGGFPVIKIFLGFMVILIGIFIVRLILKFIPTLG